mmetsp:Transcript_43201/g.113772  ORF Transcript_43201/g.113772 Transcript_43201/m.113772 type:complete len:237 (-) Transcript_43201:995-1705(-)
MVHDVHLRRRVGPRFCPAQVGHNTINHAANVSRLAADGFRTFPLGIVGPLACVLERAAYACLSGARLGEGPRRALKKSLLRQHSYPHLPPSRLPGNAGHNDDAATPHRRPALGLHTVVTSTVARLRELNVIVGQTYGGHSDLLAPPGLGGGKHSNIPTGHVEVEEQLVQFTSQTILALLRLLLRSSTLQVSKANVGIDGPELLVGIGPGSVTQFPAHHLRLSGGEVHQRVPFLAAD